MKLPAIKDIINKTVNTFLRFPFAIIISLIGTFTAMIMITGRDRNEFSEQIMLNILHTCFIGIVWFVSIDLFCEFKKIVKSKKLIFRIIGAVLLIAYYFYLPVPFLNIHIYRGVLIALALHLFVSFIPYMVKEKQVSFWNFNQEIFVRAAVSVVFSAVVFIGISVAVLAADELFKLSVNEDFYFQLWVFVVGIFNTFVFLGGFPENFETDEKAVKLPAFLKILGQYILLPLVTIYFAILYIYSIGIIMKWEMPKGIISYLVLGFSFTGIFSLLLVFPLQTSENRSWIKIFAKWFYIALIPLILLLFVAIWQRIKQYGITENRYFIIVLAIWLFGISIYMLVTKQKNIKIIPISLSIIAFMAGIGPLSAFNISKFSQIKQLEKILTENKIYSDGKIQIQENLPDSVANQIESVVNYITNTHGYKPFTKFIPKSELDSVYVAKNKNDIRTEILLKFGIEAYRYDYYAYQKYEKHYYYSAKYNNNVLFIKGFDYIIDFNEYLGSGYSDVEKDYQLGNEQFLKLKINSSKKDLCLMIDTNLIEFSIKEFIKTLEQNLNNNIAYDIDPKLLVLTDSTEKMNVKIEFNILEAYKPDSLDLYFSRLSGKIFVGLN